MNYVEQFTDTELVQIIEEGMIYMCACPAQVADALRKLRELYRYQVNCLEGPENVGMVHQTIAESAVATHAQLQDCLERVLELEQWDRTTLRMPEGLRRRQMKEMLGD
jgi:hypothetical protein